MIFFKRKKTAAPVKKVAKPRILNELSPERVLTAEGWRRRLLKTAKKK
jgi:hypothetical protein